MTLALSDARVWVVRDRPMYATQPPFDPSEDYPEWQGGAVAICDNPGYRGVRSLFRDMGLDTHSQGTAAWNPLGDIVKPGQRAVLKPNLVAHFNHGTKDLGLTDTDCLVTHGSIIRAVADYAARAVTPGGQVRILDCPIQGTSWSEVVRLTGLSEIVQSLRERFPSVDVVLEDGRLGVAKVRNGQIISRESSGARTEDYVEVDLGSSSSFAGLIPGPRGYGVTQYGRGRMREAHSPVANRYLIPKSVLEADAFINLPKMKTHIKTVVTCALKNLVGINGHKDYLPHFRGGSPRVGGDEYPDGNLYWDLTWALAHREWELEKGRQKAILAFLQRILRRTSPLLGGFPSSRYALGGGSWFGNDTIWRMILDINQALFYYDRKTGSMSQEPWPGLTYMTIGDALVAGEGDGPLSPAPVYAGLLFSSYNPVACDTFALGVMGFDAAKVPLVARAFAMESPRLAAFAQEDVTVIRGDFATNIDGFVEAEPRGTFTAPRGFAGRVEG